MGISKNMGFLKEHRPENRHQEVNLGLATANI
jgi:hypothetical protein